MKYIISFIKKLFQKAKDDTYFERGINITRQKSATVVTAATQSGSSSSWKSATYTAPVTGWYYLSNSGSSSSTATRACYITNGAGMEIRNAMYGTSRDFQAGPVWVKKGATLTYGWVYTKTTALYYTAAYEL